MDWRLAMARLQLQLEGLTQTGWRPPAPAATSLVSYTDVRPIPISLVFVTDRFSGPGRAIGRLSVTAVAFE